jgi:hypothetical protein
MITTTATAMSLDRNSGKPFKMFDEKSFHVQNMIDGSIIVFGCVFFFVDFPFSLFLYCLHFLEHNQHLKEETNEEKENFHNLPKPWEMKMVKQTNLSFIPIANQIVKYRINPVNNFIIIIRQTYGI